MHDSLRVFRLIAVLALALLATASSASAQTRTDFRWEKALAAGSRVRVHNISGDVTVTASSTGTVEVTGTKTGNSRYFDQIYAEVKETSDGIVVCVLWKDDDASCDDHGYHRDNDGNHDHWGRTDMDLQVKVPANVSVAASSVSGEVTVTGAQGDIRANSVSGSVRLEHVRASSIMARSVSGSIDASIDALNGTGELTFKTVSGSVTLELPKDLSADLTMSSVSGHLDSDFEMTLSGGMSRRHIEARIGKGGRALDVGTVSGSVRLKAAR